MIGLQRKSLKPPMSLSGHSGRFGRARVKSAHGQTAAATADVANRRAVPEAELPKRGGSAASICFLNAVRATLPVRDGDPSASSGDRKIGMSWSPLTSRLLKGNLVTKLDHRLMPRHRMPIHRV